MLVLPRSSFVFFACFALAACGDDGGSTVPDAPAADAALRDTVMTSRTLVASDLLEGVLTGGPADQAVITLTAPTADMDWNIHGHANGGTQVIMEDYKVASMTYAFTPPSDGEWYLLVRNSSTADLAVEIKIELYGAMTWTLE